MTQTTDRCPDCGNTDKKNRTKSTRVPGGLMIEQCLHPWHDQPSPAPVARTIRQRVYDFMGLPTHVKLERLRDLGIYVEGDVDLPGDEQDLIWMKRAKEKGLENQLLDGAAHPVTHHVEDKQMQTDAKVKSMTLAIEPCPDCGSNRHRSCNPPTGVTSIPAAEWERIHKQFLALPWTPKGIECAFIEAVWEKEKAQRDIAILLEDRGTWKSAYESAEQSLAQALTRAEIAEQILTRVYEALRDHNVGVVAIGGELRAALSAPQEVKS